MASEVLSSALTRELFFNVLDAGGGGAGIASCNPLSMSLKELDDDVSFPRSALDLCSRPSIIARTPLSTPLSMFSKNLCNFSDSRSCAWSFDTISPDSRSLRSLSDAVSKPGN